MEIRECQQLPIYDQPYFISTASQAPLLYYSEGNLRDPLTQKLLRMYL